VSEARNENLTASAKEVRARAAEWVLQKRASEDWSAENQVALDAWLAQSPAHLIAYWRLDDAWDRTNRLAALKRPEAEDRVEVGRKRLPAIASAFFAAALIGVTSSLYLYASSARDRAYETPLGGHRIVRVADGSQIELNTDTLVHVRESRSGTTVVLDRGEAYFQVKHNATRPFAVIVADHRVTDLGTKFMVRRDTGRLEVAVMEGRVKLEAANSAQTKPALIAAGESAFATARAISVTEKQTQNINDELGWRRGVLVFHHTSLVDAAAEFNRYNGRKIIVADDSTARMTINGTFPMRDVSAFVRLSRAILGLRIDERGGETVISR
jgi:transmembrane sensor